MPNKLTKYVSNNLWLQVQLELYDANAIRTKQGEVFFLMRYYVVQRRQYAGVGLNGLNVLNWTIVWCGGNEESMPAGIERNARWTTYCQDSRRVGSAATYIAVKLVGSTAHNTMILPSGFTMSSEMFNWNREPTSYMHAYIGENACIAYKPTSDTAFGYGTSSLDFVSSFQ